MTTTTSVRESIVQRLLALASHPQVSIGAVCNPDEIRNPENRAPAPQLTAVLWTMPGQMLGKQGNRIKWQQPFTVDIAVPWAAGAEARCDAIRLALAAALTEPMPGLPVQKQELAEVETGYPAEGSGYALVSGTVTLEYIETLTP